MKLKSVEIQGFKSFPDKTRLTFEKDITAVIGPNGNGKSNISDSIRWVLGEQSNKMLRGHKMEDVIFSGTAKRKPLGFAEVSLTLDNSDRTLNFDNDTVTVTRRYYRSGESEYKINGASVRLKDIHELFMDTGLGRDGYSMIGQGRIDEIVNSRSDERREIFEEAAGISKYRYRKIESERELKRAEDNLVRLRDIFAELESRVGPLSKQAEKAQAFLTYSEQKRTLEIGLWLNTISRSKDLLREQEYKITLAKSQYDDITAQLANIEANSEINLQDSRAITARIDEIRIDRAKAEEETSKINGDVAVYENTISMNLQTVDMLKADIERCAQDDTKTAEQIALCESEIETAKVMKAQVTHERAQIIEQMNSLANDTGSFSEQIEKKNRELSLISLEISNSRVALAKAQTTSQEAESRFAELDKSLCELQKTIDDCEKEIKNIDIDLKDVVEKINECKNVCDGNELMLSTRKQKFDTQNAKLHQLMNEINENERRAQILSDLERNMDGFSYAVKAVSTESKRGTLKGIHGPVSRLIKVQDDYAIAIETALGAAMQNIVVDDENCAKRAINFLKSNKSGRATFLPLTSVKAYSLKEQGVDDEYGFVGFADSLVSFDKKYTDIIGSLLRRTVVCEDMDCAVAMARKYNYRFRIVTLDGQIVNAGGSMTGGSHVKGAGLLSRTAEIEKLKNKAEAVRGEYETLSAQNDALKAQILKYEAQINAAKDEINIFTQDKIRLDGERRRYSEQLENAKERRSQIEKTKNDYSRRSSDTGAEIANALKFIAENEQKKGTLENEIQLLSGGRDELSQKREALSEKISELGVKLMECDKNIDLKLSIIEQCNLNKTDRENRVSSLNSQIANYLSENEQISHKIEQLKILMSGFLAKFDATDKQIEELEERRTELEQNVYSMRAKEKELSSQKEYAGSELARLQAKKETMEKEYDNIISKLFDEYQLTVEQAYDLEIEIEDEKTASKQLNEFRSKIRALGTVNLAAIEEFKEVDERYKFMKAQISDIESSKEQLIKLINNLTGQMKDLFSSQFEIISKNFTQVFKELFGGGTANLVLADPENVLESNIDINVQPPGKSISIIEQLSGGEKALIAVAIYFAIMKVNAPPFCLLDEVEAALDEVNVDRFAQYLRKMSGATQFILITHRRGTMEEADVLYGVTMQEPGVSKLLSIDVSEIDKTMAGK